MMPSRGMGAMSPMKLKALSGKGDSPFKKFNNGGGVVKTRKDGDKFTEYAEGGKVKSKVNEAGNYTKPGMRKSMFESIKAQAVQGTGAGQWSARKSQLLAKKYKAAGGGYK